MMAKKMKTQRKKVQRRKTSKAKRSTPLVPLVFGLLLLGVFLVGGISWYFFEKPVETSLQSAVTAFRARNVSEMVLMDLASDFSGNNLTLRQLGQKYPGFGEDIRAVNAYLRAARQEVLASVNGVPITREEFERQVALLPAAYQGVMNDEQILREMIDEELLLQEADRLGLMPTREEVDDSFAQLLQKSQVTEEQLLVNIGVYGLTLGDLRTLLSRQLAITKLFTERVEPLVNVTDAEAKTFYDQNPTLFLVEGEATVRHILVAVTDGRDAAAAKSLAEEALGKYRAGTDFCDLVAEYSDDGGSKQTCGEYTFGRGVMVQEFEDASFAMKDGETRIVQTSFGQHLILKRSETAPRTLSFDQVVVTLKSQLAEQRRLEVYQQFIQGLRDTASIINHVAPTLEQVVVEPSSTTASATGPVIDGFVDCLAEKGAVLYIASWDAASKQELAKFGTSASRLATVDCADDANKASCAGVEAYPTWKLNGKLVLGSQPFDQLAAATGCDEPE